ncbi:pyrBI operon leader peptide, partial [Salmonella enterica]
LKKHAGMPFFFPLKTNTNPINSGDLFCPGVRI